MLDRSSVEEYTLSNEKRTTEQSNEIVVRILRALTLGDSKF